MIRFCIGLSITFVAATAWAAEPATPAAASPAPAAQTPAEAYRAFVESIYTRPNLTDFAQKSDALIDAGEKASEEGRPGRNVVSSDTNAGFHLEFAIIKSPEAILYYASISRNGEPLRYAEAATVMSLFCDRIGLPHPVDLREGEKPIFHAQWLINPKEWKALRKKMLEVRAANRAIADIGQALELAVGREMDARAAAKRPAK